MKLLIISSTEEINQSYLLGLKQEGFLVDNAKHTQRGIWLARTNCYDVIVLSLENISTLKKMVSTLSLQCPTSFILVACDPKKMEEKLDIFELGADEIMGKNFSFKELVLKLRILLKREKNVKNSQLICEVDDLVLSPLSYKVFRGGREIYLRRKEFDLLYFLFRNQDRILSRLTILENVWDSNADFLTNTLEVHILNLRKKIDLHYPRGRRLIQTIYGRGYRFGLVSSFMRGA